MIRVEGNKGEQGCNQEGMEEMGLGARCSIATLPLNNHNAAVGPGVPELHIVTPVLHVAD